ncbi:MAG: hypothetical protein ACOX4D_06190 [Bacteroidales bacterium]|jgi:type II secretory pathway pseudopilin PulG
MKKVVHFVLIVVIVVLAVLLVKSIQKPIKFNKEKEFRKELSVQKLKDIRAAQIAFRSVNKRYTGSFDTLVDFIEHGQLAIVKMIPDPTDTTFTRSILDTIGYTLVKDTLFADRPDFDASKLSIIPNSGGEKYKLEAGTIEKSKIQIPVFRAEALWTQILKGMDEQSIINDNAKLEVNGLFPGLYVGSMEESSTDGNWE